MDTKPVDLEAVERAVTWSSPEAVAAYVSPLVAEVRRLREALAPFVAEWDALVRIGEETKHHTAPVHVSDCKRAKEVLP